MLKRPETSSISSGRKKGMPSFLRGKSRRQSKDCLNGNILTDAVEQAPSYQSDEQSNQSRFSKLTSVIKSFKNRKNKTSRKNSAAAVSEKSLVLPTDRVLGNAQDNQESATIFGICGDESILGAMPATGALTQREDSRVESLERELHALQVQVHDLNEELDCVYTEKEDVVTKLDKIIRESKLKKKKWRVPGERKALVPELEEIRLILTAEETEISLTETVKPFYCSLCSCVDDGC